MPRFDDLIHLDRAFIKKNRSRKSKHSTAAQMHEITKIKLGDLTFDCRVAGDPKGELIMFLHGFPETSYMWRGLMEHFASLGYYCVAPNMRGCSKGACPKGKEHYSFNYLVDDVLGLFKYFSKSKFHLIGHDWGAAIGWQFAHDHPEFVMSFTALSFPHNQAFKEAIVSNKDQQKRAFYSKLFALPFFPEFAMTAFNYSILKRIWANSAPEELEDYLRVYQNTECLSSFLNYYRVKNSIYKTNGPWKALGNIHTPTLFVWGNKDSFIGKCSASESHKYMKNDYTYLELDANHWLMQTNFLEVKNAVEACVLKNSSQAKH